MDRMADGEREEFDGEDRVDGEYQSANPRRPKRGGGSSHGRLFEEVDLMESPHWV